MAKKNDGLHNFKSYGGNPNLKRVGVGVEWTAELATEWIRCKRDPIYFCEKYMKIISEDGLVSFILYPYQREMMMSMVERRFTIIATARQAGKSTVTCGFILWYIIFHSEKTVALLANKFDTAQEILGKVELAYQHLPHWLQQGTAEWNKRSFSLENNSRVIASATSGDAIRGFAIDLLFIDEAAHIENWDEFFTSTFPTISSRKTSKVVLVSTPKGLNHFWQTWDLAIQGKNEYNPIKVTWDSVPGRDEAWKATYMAGINFDQERFEQEQCVEFLGSSGTLISGAALKQLKYFIPEPLELYDGLSQYDKPIEGDKYCVVADTSRGKGLDYHAAQVINITRMPYVQVAAFRNNVITPADYAGILFSLCKIYNEAVVLVEINDLGQQVADFLYDTYEYENLLFTENAGRAGKRISLQSGDRGVRTTDPLKSQACSLLKLLVEQQKIIIKDFDTISELSTFSRKGSKLSQAKPRYEAEPGKHDDMVTGLWLFAWLSDQAYFRELTDIHTLRELRMKSDDDLLNELAPFGAINDHYHNFTDDEEKPEQFKGWFHFEDDRLNDDEFGGSF